MNDCIELSSCLCCQSGGLRMILDLGNQSPVNNYNVTEKFPLRLNICLDCSHAQLSHAINPEILFKDYPFMSGVSQTMKKYYDSFAAHIEMFPYDPQQNPATVYEIACNDGSQLNSFKKLGYETHGIDPAQNLTAGATAMGHTIECGFFPSKSEKVYDIIVAQNILAHTDNPYEFLKGCSRIMHKGSILCIQTSQAKMIENHQSDTIYHEHISFFNKRSIGKLFSRCDLEIAQHTFVPDIHGGSDLWILNKMPEISILDYSDFSNRCYKFADEFRKKIEEIQKDHLIVCYGAAAKMINLIRFTGIKPDHLIDDTPLKIGRYTSGLPIRPSTDLDRLKEGSYIIPVWNFYDEIKSKIENEHPKKFKYIKYIPKIVIE